MFETITKNLQDLGYTVSCFETSQEAVSYLDQRIDGVSIGIGGSVTIEQMGLYDKLISHNQVYWHTLVSDPEEVSETRKKAADSKIYLSSVNGIAETGEIINIDGRGNRVSSIFYGHDKVYLLVGKNKIRPTFDEALDRARNIAAPLNAKRLKRNTPCAVKADHCYNCSSPDRICRELAVLWENPMGADIEVVLIDEELGY